MKCPDSVVASLRRTLFMSTECAWRVVWAGGLSVEWTGPPSTLHSICSRCGENHIMQHRPTTHRLLTGSHHQLEITCSAVYLWLANQHHTRPSPALTRHHRLGSAAPPRPPTERTGAQQQSCCFLLLFSFYFLFYSHFSLVGSFICNTSNPDLNIDSFGRLLKTHLFQQYWRQSALEAMYVRYINWH